MFFSSSNIQKLQLPRYIISIFHIAENDPDDFTCIQDNSDLTEFNTNIISSCKLKRPSTEMLKDNGHISRTEVASTAYYKGEHVIIGYEDGLILVWSTSKIEKLSTNFETNNIKPYLNIFSLKYIFIGHTRRILSILQNDSLLFTTGEDYIMKIWNLDVYIINLGRPTYI
jgi:hypothetical protein